VNDRWCQLAGMSATEAGDGGWLRAVHPDDRKMVSDAWDQSITDGRSFGPMTFRLVNSMSVAITMVHQRASVVRNSDGDINGWVGTVIPVSVVKPA
jgi:PAS domain-containing protein